MTVTTTVTNMRWIVVGLVTLGLLTSCGDPSLDEVEPDQEVTEVEATEAVVENSQNDGLFPTVVGATASTNDGTTWQVSVTLSSEYDTPSRYADAWRVDLDVVFVEARDQVNGWNGERYELVLER